MTIPDEYKSELLTAYAELGTALDRIESAYGLSDDDRSPEETIDILLSVPDIGRDLLAACDEFNEKVVALQRRSFRVLHGGRQ